MVDQSLKLSTRQAFDLYETWRHRLPPASFPSTSCHVRDLSEIAEVVDAFVLDAFGVLNVGRRPVPGALSRVQEFRRAGKKVVLLTNSASNASGAVLRKYRKLGFNFSATEVVTSRATCAIRLSNHGLGGVWSVIGTETDNHSDLPMPTVRWTAAGQRDFDGFLLLSAASLDPQTYATLRDTLVERPRPLLVANPDVVSPGENGLSREPGYFAHRLADEIGVEPAFFGKPFQDAFDDVKTRLGDISPDKVAMVGDTLHTDILGGAAAGFRTVLISDFGLFAGEDIELYVGRSGIVPNYICKVV